MRYQLWDVLLFPEPSNVPIQEFKTACFVTQDAESNGPIPTMTTFVPSLPRGSLFRVSIHSWDAPKLSPHVEAFKAAGEKIFVGVRVIIDGVCLSCETFDVKSDWPQVMNLSNTLKTKGAIEPLKFPPFHSELLDQAWWNAGESLGRIKVVISDGIDQSPGQGKVQFRPLTNMVCFSFQPAPLDVLEHSTIAWPNASLWLAYNQAMNSTQSFGVPSHSQAALTSGPETHAHSPRRRKVHNAASSCYSGHSFQTARPPTAFDMPDPFVDNQSLRSTPSFHPLPMNGQNMMSRPSPQGKGFELRLPDDQFARLIEALSPRARSRYVTPSEQANQQANQILASTVDSSSQPSVLVGPPLDPKQQSAATQRAQNGGGMTLWDSFYASRASDGKHGRDPTDISMHMGCTDFPNCHHDGPHETQVTIDSPAKRVKGKKEGSGSKEKDERNFTPTTNQSPEPAQVAQQSQQHIQANGEKRKRSALGSGAGIETSSAAVEGTAKKISTRSRSSISALLQEGENKENT